MMFIKLTRVKTSLINDAGYVYFNMEHIIEMRRVGDRTVLYVPAGSIGEVLETPEDIMQMLQSSPGMWVERKQ